MTIYGCQFDIVWEDKAANYAKVRGLLAAAQPAPGALVVLPEMFATGFSMNVADIAEEPITGPTGLFLSQCASEWGVYLLGGFVITGAEGKGRNMLAVFAPDGSCAASYSKIHPFSFGEESLHYLGGMEICQLTWRGGGSNSRKSEVAQVGGTVETRVDGINREIGKASRQTGDSGRATVAPFICYDLRFPEVFRRATFGGAEILIVIASWPQPRASHWRTLLQARAIENQAYVAGINRCGRDPGNAYAGGSLLIDPRGNILADAGDAERVIFADLDLDMLRAYRAEFPALRDARPEVTWASVKKSSDRLRADETANRPLR